MSQFAAGAPPVAMACTFGRSCNARRGLSHVNAYGVTSELWPLCSYTVTALAFPRGGLMHSSDVLQICPWKRPPTQRVGLFRVRQLSIGRISSWPSRNPSGKLPGREQLSLQNAQINPTWKSSMWTDALLLHVGPPTSTPN